MKCVWLAIGGIIALGAPASAGTYLGLGIGTAPEFNEQSERIAADSRSAKLVLGSRFGNLALEGALGGYALAIADGSDRPFGDAYQASGALKLSLPLGNHFEAFGRGGVHHTWIRAEAAMNDVEGNGILLGAGFEYRLNLVLGQGSLFVDYQYNQAVLEGERFAGNTALDTSSRMFMLGLTVGL